MDSVFLTEFDPSDATPAPTSASSPAMDPTPAASPLPSAPVAAWLTANLRNAGLEPATAAENVSMILDSDPRLGLIWYAVAAGWRPSGERMRSALADAVAAANAGEEVESGPLSPRDSARGWMASNLRRVGLSDPRADAIAAAVTAGAPWVGFTLVRIASGWSPATPTDRERVAAAVEQINRGARPPRGSGWAWCEPAAPDSPADVLRAAGFDPDDTAA